MSKIEYWIWLSRIPTVGPTFQKRLLEVFGTPENIYRASYLELLEVDGVGEVTAKKITMFRLDDVKKIINDVEKLHLSITTNKTKKYAEIFSCPHVPILFYYKGELPRKRGVAVVGARRCTEEAKRVAEEIAAYVAKSGLPVISGLAKGVDSYAHTASLNAGGTTSAILASGVDICYPKEHQTLYEKIVLEGGAIISAFPPGTKPHPKFFVERNAHISAWATDVIIVQASERSGSLITARFAKEQGRKVYSVPYSIYLKEAKGSNKLLNQGALPYLGPKSLKLPQILSQKPPEFPLNKIDELSPLQQKIIACLSKSDSLTFEQIALNLQVSEFDLTSEILSLEIKNLVRIKGRQVIKR